MSLAFPMSQDAVLTLVSVKNTNFTGLVHGFVNSSVPLTNPEQSNKQRLALLSLKEWWVENKIPVKL
jgi:hypothetical protein